MPVQWYPGHMHKAGKEIRQILPRMDVILELLDARIPFSSQNPLLASLGTDKPVIKLLNKADLADAESTRQWLDFLQQQAGVRALPISALSGSEVGKLPGLCRELLGPKHRGSISGLVMGIPNVGKSTLLNTLSGRSIARTGNEPAVTRRQQRVRLDDEITLFDTPGMLWPNLENPNTGYRLAMLAAVRDTALDHTEVALFAVSLLARHWPGRLQQRFDISAEDQSDIALLEAIGSARGCLGAAGRVDLDRAAKLLLTEIRHGRLGPVTLEWPEDMHQELQQLEQLRAHKAARKEARKARRKQGSRKPG